RLGLSIPLFDGFARDVNTQRAKVQTRTSRAQLAEAERSVRTQAERALDQLELAAERVALSREAVVSAEEDLRVQQERYDLGVSTMLELLTSQEALVAAENEEVAALFNQDLARAQLEALTGRTPRAPPKPSSPDRPSPSSGWRGSPRSTRWAASRSARCVAWTSPS